MQFYHDMYVSETLSTGKIRHIKWKLKHHKHMLGIYVVTLSEQDELEFYRSEFLYQDYYIKNPPFIVGIAEGWDGACELVQQMLSDVFAKTGNYRVKQYILQSAKERRTRSRYREMVLHKI